jgi:hypothetical protein
MVRFMIHAEIMMLIRINDHQSTGFSMNENRENL